MKFLISILFTGFAASTFAQSETSPFVPNYECRLMLILEDNKHEEIDEKFLADYGSRGHGGMERIYENGRNKVIVQASNNWMAIQWEQSGKIVTAGHFVISKPSDFHRVVIMMNPKNTYEQVSLDCSPEPE